MEEHGRLFSEEMKRIREQLQPTMEQLKDEVGRARAEFHRVVEKRQRQSSEHRDRFDTGFWPSRGAKFPPKKRPRRKPPGSAPAPVKPRPKPAPLMDGAEAPIE